MLDKLSSLERTNFILKLTGLNARSLLNLPKYVDWNNTTILYFLNNIEVILFLYNNGEISQESLNFIFKTSKKLNIIKKLWYYVTVSSVEKTKSFEHLFDTDIDNYTKIISFLKKKIKNNELDWFYMSNPIYPFYHNVFGTIIKCIDSDDIIDNIPSTKGNINFVYWLLNNSNFIIETHTMEVIIWHTFHPEIILTLLKKESYNPISPANYLLDNGMISEFFPTWGEKNTNEFIEYINRYNKLHDYIIQNSHEKLYTNNIKDIFIF